MQMYLERRSQKSRKHSVKSPCSSSTTSACTQFHQPHTKAPINPCHMHGRKTSWKTRFFKLHLAFEILLQNEGISSSNLYRHWGRKRRQASLSCANSTLLHSLLYTYNSYILLQACKFSSVPFCKGRALSSPPVTSSQMLHQ